MQITSLWSSIVRVDLLEMPSWVSLQEIGEAAEHFTNSGEPPDGLLLLAPLRLFSAEELKAALSAGGRVVEGYAAPYPFSGVEVGGDRPVDMGVTILTAWSGYRQRGIVCSLEKDTLLAVLMAAERTEWRVKPPKEVGEKIKGEFPKAKRVHFSAARFLRYCEGKWRLECCASWRNQRLFFHPLTGEEYLRFEL